MNWGALILLIIMAIFCYIWGRLDGRDKWRKRDDTQVSDFDKDYADFALFLYIQLMERDNQLDSELDLEEKIKQATVPFIGHYAYFKAQRAKNKKKED